MRLTERNGVADWMWVPLSASTRVQRWLVIVLCTWMTAAGSLLVHRQMGSSFGISDAAEYVHMAQGRMTEVEQPFASRPLAPFAVRGLAAAAHVPVETGFRWLAAVSLVWTLGVVFALAMRSAAPRWMLPMLAGVWFWPQLAHSFVLPDLTYAALLSALLLCLFAGRYGMAATAMFPLMAARESTALVLVCLLLVAWRPLRVGGRLLAPAATLLGALVAKRLAAGAAGNVEHLPAAMYMLGKVPWNLLRTAGVQPWSNLYPYLCAAPMRVYPVQFGPLRGVGVCRFSTLAPSLAADALLTIFGVLLPLACALWPGWRRWNSLSPAVQFCLLYGGVSFLLTPALGTAYPRLFGYGWPLFLVGLPALFEADSGQMVETGWWAAGRRRPGDTLLVAGLLLVQGLLAWAAFPRANAMSLWWEAALQLLGSVGLTVSRRRSRTTLGTAR